MDDAKEFIWIWGMFGLLKYEGHDMTTLVLKCLICKIVSWTRQTGGKGYEKSWNYCPSLNHNTTFFISSTSFLNTIFSIKKSFLNTKITFGPSKIV